MRKKTNFGWKSEHYLQNKKKPSVIEAFVTMSRKKIVKKVEKYNW